MWKFDDDGYAYNTDDPRDFMFVKQQISIVRHKPGVLLPALLETGGFFSVDAAKKHLAQMVKALNEGEACK